MYQLAQINIAKMIGINIDDPVMKEFVDNLEHVNQLAENSDGFIWRLKDETNNATEFNPYHDEQIIINISVWKDIESLENFTYRTFHTDFLKRRKEWFSKYGEAHYALWWIKNNEFPTIREAVERLDYLQKNKETDYAFSFKKRHF
ncbi:hypothetical protein EB1_29020 [Empedobacter brevis NBRC 14943 = ATCC 43319]|uniref:DUF3291 domain-containing protein n=1 Tax=Empedobacter brevis NBRC 14943 = ATCC 43319 TaxID=1218108 RepID=A0A511NJX2_9FLAO|nr:DUF3291 domain-containing protein [Empedobacter brevis]GEM53112.1 hypothetical protein EB1_29020 [Empedobacter brevis NBRC 14943 = ATCC 43319]